MIDAKAHERLNHMEIILSNHSDKINALEVGLADQSRAITENTTITKNIETNTAELVQLFKNVKSLRQMVLFYAPLAAVVAFVWAGISWLSAHLEKIFS